MESLEKILETELAKARARCSTNNQWDLPYSQGIEFALKKVREANSKIGSRCIHYEECIRPSSGKDICLPWKEES